MKRAVVIVAIAWFVVLGTGAAEYAHNAQHAREDANSSPRSSRRDSSTPVHNDSNCAVHAQLHQPLTAMPVVMLLICAGLLVAFVSQLAPAPDSVRIPSRIDCRGPPALV